MTIGPVSRQSECRAKARNLSAESRQKCVGIKYAVSLGSPDLSLIRRPQIRKQVERYYYYYFLIPWSCRL